MNLPLQRLEGFYWVARLEGYARAARAFPYPISQPGVHQQVRRLEDELGTKLFERVGKDRVVLTAAGRSLYAFVAPFLEQLPAQLTALRSGTFGGPLRVHAAGLVLRGLLPAWLRRVHRRHPEIDVTLTQLETPDLAVLRGGESDLLVDYLEEVPDDIAVRKVGQTQTFLAMPSDHPQAKRKRPSLVALADDTFITYHADARIRALQLRALELHGRLPKRTFGADSAETILGFVAAGVGWSLIPWLEGRGPRVPGVVALPFRVPGSTFPVYAAWRKHAPPNPFVAAALALAPELEKA
jgi:DNA-binding transcriptional LysR family regulator